MDWAPLWRGPSSPANQILRLSRFARFARLASVLVGNAATPAVITKRLELSTKVARTTRSHLSAFSALANEPRAVSAQLRLTVAATRANWRDRTESERLGKISALVIGLGSVATLLILLVSLSCGATELVALGGAVADVEDLSAARPPLRSLSSRGERRLVGEAGARSRLRRRPGDSTGMRACGRLDPWHRSRAARHDPARRLVQLRPYGRAHR